MGQSVEGEPIWKAAWWRGREVGVSAEKALIFGPNTKGAVGGMDETAVEKSSVTGLRSSGAQTLLRVVEQPV